MVVQVKNLHLREPGGEEKSLHGDGDVAPPRAHDQRPLRVVRGAKPARTNSPSPPAGDLERHGSWQSYREKGYGRGLRHRGDGDRRVGLVFEGERVHRRLIRAANDVVDAYPAVERVGAGCHLETGVAGGHPGLPVTTKVWIGRAIRSRSHRPARREQCDRSRRNQPTDAVVPRREELGGRAGFRWIQADPETDRVTEVAGDAESAGAEVDVAERDGRLRPTSARLRDRTARTHREVDDRRVDGVTGHGRHEDDHHRREGVQASGPERREPLTDMAGAKACHGRHPSSEGGVGRWEGELP